jgi:hypothetical protein
LATACCCSYRTVCSACCAPAGDEAAAAAQQAALEAAALALHQEQQPNFWTDYLQVNCLQVGGVKARLMVSMLWAVTVRLAM